jgi:CRP-like cAMP-binding protein/tetratricopeptide (TPR) repeat protein
MGSVADGVTGPRWTYRGTGPVVSAIRAGSQPLTGYAGRRTRFRDGLTVKRDDGSDPGAPGRAEQTPVADIPVAAGSVRWERPTVRSFWNSLADPEREALAAAGVEEFFRPGAVLCRVGDDTSQVMVIDSGWVKVSVRDALAAAEKILAVRGQGDVVGERAALTSRVRSATVTALDEVSALVVPAERFAEFLRGHPRAAEVLERQVTERSEEDRMRLFPGGPPRAERASAERRLAWLLLDLAQRRGGYQQTSATVFTLPMSHQELADWADTSADAVGRFLRSWRDRGIVARGERARRVTVVDLDGLAALCDAEPTDQHGDQARETALATSLPHVPQTQQTQETQETQETQQAPQVPQMPPAPETAGRWQLDWAEPLNCSVMLTDVAGFSDPVRTDGDRDVVRAAMYEILRSAFEVSGVPWAACYREDRGDGAVIVVPPTISTQRVVDPFIHELASRLRQHNRRASEVVRIQLRVALHAGPVGRDAEGLTGRAVISVARIVDAPVIKARLAAEQADLIFAASDYVYDHVVRNCAGQVDPAAFEHMECQVKESRVAAWVHLSGRVALPPAGLTLDAVGGQALAPGSAPGPLPVAAPLGKLPPEVRGREGLIGELRRALRPYPWRASRAFVIAGMGGIGKSTVALTAARMARERGYRVWWVRAADAALLTSGMLEVLRELGAPESVTVPVREGARTAPARAWEFLNGDHVAGRRWLLVFEGANNPAVLADADAAAPADGTGWLRADPAGMVIVTTRIRDPQVWGTGITLRELRPLDDEAGAEVLRDLAPEVTDPGGREARELSGRLGGLPLALHLAGAYLGSPFARWSTFAGYRRALDGVELPAALTDIEQGADIQATVQRTWDLSLDALAAEGRPQARPLLLVLSCLAPATPIPAWLLRLPPLADLLAGEASPPDTEAKDINDAERRGLRAGLQGLTRTGLIDIRSSGGPAAVSAVTVHPVVADANRIRLAASAAAERAAVQDTAVALLEAATAGLDPVKPGDWPTWRLLMPHVNAVIDLLADDLDPAVLGRLLIVSAVGTEALLGAGRLAAAERLAQASVAAAALLSRDDPAALTARGYLARALVRRGRSGEAESIYRDLLADRVRVQGDSHLDTLATRHDLAAALGVQGRYTEAEQLYRQLLGDDYRLRGPEHRETLAARHNLARMIGLQGRFAEAEELSRQVLDSQRRVLGPDHPDCLASRQALARLAVQAGRYAEAEELYRRVLADRRRVLGEDHPDTLATRHRLARIVGQRGRYGEAEELCHQVLADRRRLLGEDHPDNLSTRHRLARMLGLQGRYAAAEPMFRQVLAARRRTLGADHPDTLSTEHRLGWLIGRQGRYSEAIDIVNEVLGGRRNVLGDDHPDTLAARETLAWLTGLRGKSAEAGELAREVLADRRRVLGEDHPDTLTTRGTLAWLTELRGRYADAEQQYRGLLADRQRILGHSHPDTLTARQDVARMLGAQRRYADAERLSREVLADRRRLLGDDHPDTLTSRAVLARAAASQGRRAEAGELYRQVIADRTRVLGASHPDTAAVRHELAQLTGDRG